MCALQSNGELIPFRKIADDLLRRLLPKEHYGQIANASNYVYTTLARDLPPNLYYHGVRHTKEDVVPATIILANSEGIGPDNLFVLLGGAITHDTGFTKKYWANEPIGAEIAGEVLQHYGYDPTQVKIAQNIVLATALPQNPKTLLEALMCDADLFNISRRSHFWQTADYLLRERIMHYAEIPPEFRVPKTLVAWYEQQLDFLKKHEFFTEAGRRLGGEGKQYNIRELEELLKALSAR